MPTPQSGILPAASGHALFVMLRRRLGRRADATLRTLLAGVPARIDTLAGEATESLTLGALGIGAEAWPDLFGPDAPKELRSFPRIPGAIHPAPATDADLLLHLRGERCDLLFELGERLVAELGEWYDPVETCACFRYRDGRDLTGFAEGTENPVGQARAEAALVGDEDPAWAGGSYVHVQRYVHRMNEWQKLPVKQQEAVIGRTKEADQALNDEDKPLTAHVRRVEIGQGTQKLALLRHSMPYGLPGGEKGLMFASYCRTPRHFEKMLTRMVAPTADGRVDHMLNYTRAVSGAAFFVPSREVLTALAR
ncbi:Dyp-type peroxidase [Chitiniphilus purpureus]|uniref:Dyp-type peroxidase n=1 Tax=Chitiniphilus purpureus TaxID=2981137 RepID=A0ABY6DL31_9NEIS|nr:Dyp-type peroxidase [Chitiniphilus sp. CD1]UXY15054.1 Dyp-type peroxidase [Chitiniphilus sp. CD1]